MVGNVKTNSPSVVMLKFVVRTAVRTLDTICLAACTGGAGETRRSDLLEEAAQEVLPPLSLLGIQYEPRADLRWGIQMHGLDAWSNA